MDREGLIGVKKVASPTKKMGEVLIEVIPAMILHLARFRLQWMQ